MMYRLYDRSQLSVRPSLNRQDDGRWILELQDANVALILDADQVRAINDDYLNQLLGGPIEDCGE